MTLQICHALQCVQEPTAGGPAPKKRAKVSRSPAERPARSRSHRELIMEHNPLRERDDCYMIQPMGDMFDDHLPAQKQPRARKSVKVWLPVTYEVKLLTCEHSSMLG